MMILAGCESSEPTESILEDGTSDSADAAAADSESMACQQSDFVGIYPDLVTSTSLPLMSATVPTTPFRCLRFLDSAELSRGRESMTIVDTRRDGADGRLKIPLYEIKAKAFLRDSALAIVSDGKHFAALEKECTDIKRSGVTEVFAILPPRLDLTSSDELNLSQLPEIKPQEYIAERAFGVWHVVDLTSKGILDSPLFRNSAGSRDLTDDLRRDGRVVGLERTLIVLDDSRLPDDADLASLRNDRGQIFVLVGGMEGFLRYQAEATAMANALTRPRINQRGCNG